MYLHIHGMHILSHAPTCTTRVHTLSPADYRGVCAGSCDPSHEPVLAPKVFQVCELPHWTSRCWLCEEPGKVCCHSVSTVSYPSPISFQDYLTSFKLGSFPDRAPNPFQLGSFPTCVVLILGFNGNRKHEITVTWAYIFDLLTKIHRSTPVHLVCVPVKGRGRLILSFPSHDPGQS